MIDYSKTRLNFNCNNLIYLHYDNGAGGKFISNCLGLSDDCVFQHRVLAKMQLDGKFTFNDKISYIKNAIDLAKKYWNDLGMGDSQLMGMPIYMQREEYILSGNSIYDLKYDPILCYLSNTEEKYFFLTSHSFASYDYEYSKIFKNSKIIVFKNTRLFCTMRNYGLSELNSRFINIWFEHREEDWPLFPPTTKKNFDQMSDDIKNKMLLLYKDDNNGKDPSFKNKYFPKGIKEYLSLSDEEKNILIDKTNGEFRVNPKNNIVYEWDTNWYFDREMTISKIKELYKLFNLSNYNEEKISWYYDIWINKMIELEEKYDCDFKIRYNLVDKQNKENGLEEIEDIEQQKNDNSDGSTGIG
jgi:hypothetical protein